VYHFRACCQDDDAPVVEDVKDEADDDEEDDDDDDDDDKEDGAQGAPLFHCILCLYLTKSLFGTFFIVLLTKPPIYQLLLLSFHVLLHFF